MNPSLRPVRVRVRAGTQTNCGGIAVLELSVEGCQSAGLELTSDVPTRPDDDPDAAMGDERWMPESFWRAVQTGVERAARGHAAGLRVRLTWTCVHPVDGRARWYERAAEDALRRALARMAGAHDVSAPGPGPTVLLAIDPA